LSEQLFLTLQIAREIRDGVGILGPELGGQRGRMPGLQILLSIQVEKVETHHRGQHSDGAVEHQSKRMPDHCEKDAPFQEADFSLPAVRREGEKEVRPMPP
jgi:hypothetical protein